MTDMNSELHGEEWQAGYSEGYRVGSLQWKGEYRYLLAIAKKIEHGSSEPHVYSREFAHRRLICEQLARFEEISRTT